MASGTEEETAVGIAEGRVVGIGGNGVSGRLLFAEGHIINCMELLAISLALLGSEGFEEGAVLRAYGEMDMDAAIIVLGIERTFHQMLLEGRAGSLGIAVEFEESLRKFAIVQTLRAEHSCHDCLIVAFCHEGSGILTVSSKEAGIEVSEEGGIGKTLKEFLLEIGGGDIVVCIEEGKHVLKHSAGSTGCGDKLHHAVLRVGSILVPSGEIGFLLFGSGDIDAAVGYAGSTTQL